MSGNKLEALKAGVGYTFGNVLIKGISFLTLPIFTRLMSTAQYGLYTTFMSYESILALLIGLGLHASLKAAKIEFKDQIDSYVSSIIVFPFLFSLILMGIALPLMDSLGKLSGFGGVAIMLLIFNALATSVISIYNNRISLDYAYKRYLALSLASSISNVVLSLFLILFVKKLDPFYSRVLGTSVPMILIALMLLITFYRKAKPAVDKKFISFGFSYSLPLVPHGISQLILAQFGKIVIQQKIGNDAAGIYGFAYTIALIPQILVTSLDTAWGPWFFEQYAKGNITLIKKRTGHYVSIFSIICCVLFTISPEIIMLLAPSSYWPSIEMVIPAILGIFFTFMYTIPAQVEYYFKKTTYIAAGTVAAALINVASLIYFVPMYGYQIAVYITLLTYLLYFAAHMLIARRITNKNLPFDPRTVIVYSIIVCLVAGIMQLFRSDWLTRYLLLLMIILLFAMLNRKSIREVFHGKGRKET